MDVTRFVALAAVGVVASVAFGIWWFTPRHSATPGVVEGWARPNSTGVNDKLARIDKRANTTGTVDLGTPTATRNS
jgi:hypothetical protein